MIAAARRWRLLTQSRATRPPSTMATTLRSTMVCFRASFRCVLLLPLICACEGNDNTLPAPTQEADASSLDSPTADTIQSSSTGGSASSSAASTGTGGTQPVSSTTSGPDVVCPGFVPDAGDPCKTGLMCNYDNSTGDCERSVRASCVKDEWVVELPLDCQPPSDADASCDIVGAWDIDYTEPDHRLYGVPYPSTYVFKREVSGQYYVVLPQTTNLWFTNWRLGAAGTCEINASSRYSEVIPPADGSKCGQFNSSCNLELAFSGDTAKGTLSCSGNERSCSSSLHSWDIDVTAARVSP